ncbi:MAG: hypothetical protein KC931_07160 [Candidatus Omnitrophica bacterium]|nr:hypothetical protein [Candidatus Omnitrophota bacterium]MCA9425156.1 hypothetical protein [Candidatus Omnitrophota bacterium]MCA9442638.1 hypothetical protein [Candidatus Omnitrophota bacterium]MCA9446875.1 hypothetical protein [Candidatus Omnitrophota bacterium]
MNNVPKPPRFLSRSMVEQGLCIVVALCLPMTLVWLTGCHMTPSANYSISSDVPGSSVGSSFLASPKAAPAMSKVKMDPNSPGSLKLNHHNHIVEQGISCEDCHAIGATGRPEFPDHDTCSICHDIDIDNPGEDCMLCHVLDPADVAAGAYEEIMVLHVPEHTSDFHFDHSAFAEDSDTCTQCHTGVSSSELSTDDNRGNHDTLFPAVRSLGLDPQNCQLCHSEMSKTQPPSSHLRPGFLKTHGQDFMGGDQSMCLNCHAQNDCDTCHSQTPPESHSRPEWAHSHGKLGHSFNKDQCLMCHSDQSCQECHMSTMPKDHTNFFRRRSHGKIASWDRDRCMNCHKQDYCQACHVGSSPKVTSQPFHTPGADCLNCHSPASPVWPLKRHGPLPNDSCLKCHQFE